MITRYTGECYNKHNTPTRKSRQIQAMSAKSAGRKKVHPVLVPIPANRRYAGIKRKPGPKSKLISEKPRVPPKPVQNPYRTYNISYGLRFLSYWNTASIPSGLTTM